jgi:outer membrane receptor protein involved in Fe transport
MPERHIYLATLLLCTSPLVPGCSAEAQTSSRIIYSLPAQSLGQALRDIARIGSRQIMLAEEDVAGKTAPAIEDAGTVEEALARVLVGTGLKASISDDIILIRRVEKGRTAEDSGSDRIVVTGSRVRGAPPASPLIRITQDDIRAAGQANLGEVARSLPQSSGGGQNPGVGLGATQGNENGNGGSNFDLRGIGADATLTLVNGHRVSYGTNNQSIDVSTIPVAAVEEIEILTDGASAIYGSDAVAGVANIRLKRSYDGVTAVARIAAATEGGDVQQQYSLVTGGHWSSGGVIVTGDFERDTAIVAGDRSYIRSMAPDTTVLPGQKRYNLLMSGRQRLTDRLELELDGFYNHRNSSIGYAFDIATTPAQNGLLQKLASRSSAIAPKLNLDIGSDWTASLSGVIASDRSHYAVRLMSEGETALSYSGCYCNSTRSIEASLEGPLFALPGGDARVALGGGYRYDHAHTHRDDVFDFTSSKSASFGYAELYLPFAGAANARPLLERLTATAAVRYEDHGRNGDIATPKFGIVYAPSPSMDIKASWGRSFKVPTLFQTGFPVFAYLYDAVDAGCTDCAAGATVLNTEGGNRDLKPERATSWSATIDIHPRTMPGFSLEASWFDIRYRGRVAYPISGLSQSFDPIYARFVDTNITPEKLAGALSGAQPLENYSSADYDPTRVAAIINSSFVNVSRQSIHGADLTLRYDAPIGSRTRIDASVSGTWLRSRQQYIAGGEVRDLSGTIYNPPRLRVRGGATIRREGLAIGSFVNRTGGVRYSDGATPARLHGMTTIDVNTSYALGRSTGSFNGVEVALAIQNMFDARPDILVTDSPLTQAFDGTNYSAVGRFVSFTLTKHW